MGKGYSKEEQIEFEKYKKQFDKAINDSGSYIKYKEARAQITERLQKNTPNVERFLVDYVKELIKSTYANEAQKFNALLFLKDIMKTNNEKLLLYVDKKILNRLYLLASSNLKTKTLLQYNKNGNETWSTKFYYLLRECFDHWNNLDPKYKKYHEFYEKLSKQKLLQHSNEFWDFPLQIDTQKIRQQLEEVRKIRKNILDKIVDSQPRKLKSQQMNQMMDLYSNQIQELQDNDIN